MRLTETLLRRCTRCGVHELIDSAHLDYAPGNSDSTFVERQQTYSSVCVKETVPLKAKYYPHITILGAATLLAGPLCLVLLLPYLQSDVGFDEDIPIVDTMLDTGMDNETALSPTIALAATTDVAPAAQIPPSNSAPSEIADSGFHKTAEPGKFQDQASPGTRVAMLPKDSDPAPAMLEPRMDGSTAVTINDADAVLEMAVLDDGMHDERQPTGLEVVPIPSDVSEMAGLRKPVVEFIEPIYVAPTHYDATGHLALTHGGTGAMGGTAIPPVATVRKSQPDANAKESISRESAALATNKDSGKPEYASSRAKSRAARAQMTTVDASAEEKKVSGQIAMSSVPMVSSRMLIDGTFGEKPPEILEDVILQQPLESRPVGRMENVVAVTQAKGWPIALVKSDLPDDEWWVQQMVGIRGNAFSARVNFGNENSISGSVYHLVFVFLDSPDEVRRFRIAKQFKTLPEGVRHTREFTFIRK